MKLQAFNLVHSAAMALLPAHLTCAESKAMLIAIAMQSSQFSFRRELMGHDRSFWALGAQTHIKVVAEHELTRGPIAAVCDALCYDTSVFSAYMAVEHNDILACAYARLLLSLVPGKLPSRDQPQLGWDQYLAVWRPSHPRPEPWPVHFRRAWDAV